MGQVACVRGTGGAPWSFLPDVADMGEQHEQVGQAGVLLPVGEARLADGPHQGVRNRVQQMQQPGATLQVPATAVVRRAEAHVWWRRERERQRMKERDRVRESERE